MVRPFDSVMVTRDDSPCKVRYLACHVSCPGNLAVELGRWRQYLSALRSNAPLVVTTPGASVLAHGLRG